MSETAPLLQMVELPYIQFRVKIWLIISSWNFRWGINKLEQSPMMMWVIDKR